MNAPMVLSPESLTRIDKAIAKYPADQRQSAVMAALTIAQSEKGVRFFGDGVRTSSIIMQNDPHYIRFIDSIHVSASSKDPKIRF